MFFKKSAFYIIFMGLVVINNIALADSSQQATIKGRVLFENRMPIICLDLACEDQSRIKPILGAIVVAKPINSSKRSKVVYTDQQGQYRLKLTPGKYKIYTNFQEKSVLVRKGQSLLLNFKSIAY